MNQKNTLFSVAVVLLMALGLGIWWFGRSADTDSSVVTDSGGTPIRLSVSPATGSLTTRPVMIEQNLSEKQQQAVVQQAHTSMLERLRAYNKMSPEERRKHLDEQIDQQQKMLKEGGLNIQTTTRPTGDETKVTASADGTRKSVIVRRNVNEKDAMEGMDPELRALLAQYAGDMRQRRAERGLPDSPGVIMIREETRVGAPK